jgi:hypothetical protein
MQGGKCTKCETGSRQGIGTMLLIVYCSCATLFTIAVFLYILIGDKNTKAIPQQKMGSGNGQKNESSGDPRGVSIRLKIFMGYAQVISYFSVTFDSIPWPQALLDIWQWLELASIDVYALFGEFSCTMQTGFFEKFNLHMLAVPVLAACIGFGCLLARVVRKNAPIEAKAFSVINFVSFTLYAGLSTRIFRVFKCRHVHDAWYLTADYSIACFDSTRWIVHAVIAAVCGFLYLLAFPSWQLGMLCLKKRHSTEDEIHAPGHFQNKFGSLYMHYKPQFYYFEFVDLSRRIILTGGLVLLGRDGVTQVFLAMLVCLCWVSLLLRLSPYKDPHDNVLNTILSIHLLLTLMSGMALRVFKSEEQDIYRSTGFGILLIVTTIICIGISFVALILSLPCVPKSAQSCVKKKQKKKKKKKKATDIVPQSTMPSRRQVKTLG